MDRVAFETARLELARLRVKPDSDHELALSHVLRLSARTLKVDRVGYWVFDEDGRTLTNRLTYTLSSDELAAGDVLQGARYPAYWAAVRQRRVIAVDDAQADVQTRELTETYLRPLAIRSMLDAPVFRAGALIGVVCHEHVGEPRAWTADELHFAGSVADLLSMALEQADRLMAEARLRAFLGMMIAAEQLEVMERLCRAVSHDFANLFAVVELVAGALAQAGERPVRADELAGSLRSVASVGSGLLQQMRRFGARSDTPPTTMPLRQVLERVVPILGTLTRDVATVEVVDELGDHDAAAVHADQIEQLILNLILNARDAIADSGTIRVGARRDGDAVVVEVADDGAGMPPEIVARIWEPYFTTKPTGTGLGLATVRAIVDEAGGSIAVHSQPGAGTRFEVRLPAA
ncbi:MAG: HAMP domain-containing histidine kinase [Kofleriaceae bacterium]|nr:HAMP domain-containing histidine kinase [Kofleriaceae bacterium]MCL4225820.1 HAMP domain-containing histidine kinase [Myxococcales bacterium]